MGKLWKEANNASAAIRKAGTVHEDQDESQGEDVDKQANPRDV